MSENGQGGETCAVCDVCFSNGRCESKADPSKASALFRFTWDDLDDSPGRDDCEAYEKDGIQL